MTDEEANNINSTNITRTHETRHIGSESLTIGRGLIDQLISIHWAIQACS